MSTSSTNADGDRSSIDWGGLSEPLSRFTGATALTTTVYDRQLHRRAGPFLAGGISEVLHGAGAWHHAAYATLQEQQIAERVIASGEPVTESLLDGIQISAFPLVQFGAARGVVVLGWVQTRFGSALGANTLERLAGVPRGQLWQRMRATQPVGLNRYTMLVALASDIVASHMVHGEVLTERLEIASRREQFLARVAHELRTPLASMTLRVDALASGLMTGDAETTAAYEAIQRSIDTQTRLIEDLVDAARTETGTLSVNRSTVDIAMAAKAAISASQPGAAGRGIVITLEPGGGQSAFFAHADRDRIEQTITILLSNAIKFSPDDQVIQVVLKNAVDEQWLVVQVRDHGPGIPVEMRQRVFEPFFTKSPPARTGLGLGLAIARQIVASHDGRVEIVTPAEGTGAQFDVYLPRRA